VSDNSLLVSQFINTAQRAGASVDEIKSSPEDLCRTLLKIISGSKNVVFSEPQFISESLFTSFKKSIDLIFTPDAKQLASAEIGITDAFAGVARTGSVCIPIRNDFGAYTSLLPQKHIVILESKNIVVRPKDIFDSFILNQSVEGSGCVFISGPSATADMGELVRGAHGPAELHIILLD
jgi:L-lactate dehydrogenase complex protein LldG